MGVDENNSKLNLLLGISVFPLMVLIGIALFISENSVYPLVGFGSAIIGGIVTIRKGKQIQKSFRKTISKI